MDGGADEWVPVEAEIDLREMRVSARAYGKSREMQRTVEEWLAKGYRVLIVGKAGSRVLEPHCVEKESEWWAE